MLLITFSGLDGCGKSTHVDRTVLYLTDLGLDVKPATTVSISATGVILFLRRWLQRMGSSALDQKTAIAPSGARIRVYDKNRTFREDQQRRTAIAKRWIAYPLDAIALRCYLHWQALQGVEAVVCDRYIFDKLVNLPDVRSSLSTIVRWLAPSADLAIFLNVTPTQARSRREEHDASYYEAKYDSYRAIVDLGWGLESVEISTIDATQEHIEMRLEQVTQELDNNRGGKK